MMVMIIVILMDHDAIKRLLKGDINIPGALYVRSLNSPSSAPLYPMLFGGGQERNFRPGTENTGMIAGLGKAAELITEHLDDYQMHMQKVQID